MFLKWARFSWNLSVNASKYVVVHLVFFSQLDHKILSYGHFNIIAQECTQWGEGIDPKLKLLFKHTPGEVMVLIQNFLFHLLFKV